MDIQQKCDYFYICTLIIARGKQKFISLKVSVDHIFTVMFILLKGQERIVKYTDILLRCGEYDKDATLKLCRWKNNRETFWTKEIHGNPNLI